MALTAASNAQAWAADIGSEGVVPKPSELPQLYEELRRFTPCVEP